MKKKILIVEDNQINSKMLTYFLQHNDFITTSINNGDAVLDECIQFRPDLVLMDIEIYGVSGAHACIKLRKIKEFENLPIFAVTALTYDKFNKEARNARFDEYVEKPIVLNDLLGKIKSYIW